MSGGRPASVSKGIGRAFGGALLFSLPILMTMEMWQLGVSMDRARLGLLLVGALVLTTWLESYFGIVGGRPANLLASLLDAGIAFLVGITTAALVLTVLSVANPARSWQDALSVVAVQALPAAIGASFARSQLRDGSAHQEPPRYRQELFLMVAGAVVFAANIAPTEEVIQLAARMTPVHALVLVALDLAVMHAFVYRVGFRGGSPPPDRFWPTFLHFTVVGYVIALGISAYLLWTFGRFDDTGLVACTMQAVVLALPASVGAAAARLVL